MLIVRVLILVVMALGLAALAWFSTRKPRETRYRCCDRFEWVAVADFGEAAGFELDLGRCGVCQTYVMAVYWGGGPSLTYVCLSRREAQRFLGLQDRPRELKKALKRWVS